MQKKTSIRELLKSKAFLIAVVAIILGGATEVTMSQWSSAFIERVADVPKVIGDILGLSGFALFLASGRTLYGMFGSRSDTSNVLIIGSALSFACYIAAAISSNPAIIIASCAITGLTASLLWPGTIAITASYLPSAGAALFALMSAAGDIGASLGSAIVGNITQLIKDRGITLFGLSSAQTGLKIGLLFAALFPLFSVFIQIALKKEKKKL